MTTTEHDVLTLVTAMAPDSPGEPGLRSALIADFGYTSLRLLELSIAVERAFALRPLNQQALAGIATVGDLVDLVRRQRNPS